MESICGSPFWNDTLTWQAEWPDLTPCFQETISLWVPFAFLWIFSPYELYKLRNLNVKSTRRSDGSRHRVPWTLISIIKVTLTVVLILLTLCQLTNVLIRKFSSKQLANDDTINPVYVVEWLTPTIQLVTFIFALLLILLDRSYSVSSSGLLFLFWMILSLSSLFTYYSLFKHLTDERSFLWHLDRVGYIIKLASIPVIVIEWFVSCFNDSLPYEYIAPGHDFNNPTPELTASFLSNLTFYWLNPLIYLGYSRPLRLEDLYDIKPVIRSSHVFAKFSSYYKPFKSAGVVMPLFKAFALEYITTSSFKLLSCFLMFVNPLILDFLLQWMVNRTPYWQGFFYAAIMFSAAVLDSMLLNQYEYRLAIISLKMRSALTEAIYRKSLRLSPDVKSKYSTGQIVNLMSVDAQRVTEFILFSNNAWSAPLIIGISIYLLWQQLGPSTITGIVVIILLIPFNGWITMIWRKSQHALMREKDKRSKLLNEVFSGIKVLKLYGWEPSFKDQIKKARDGELVNLKKQSTYMAGVTFSLSSAPIFVAIFTFITYTLIDPSNILDPSKAFVSLTLFNILRMPMTFLPLLVTFATMFFVSMKRIGDYLADEEANHEAIPNVKGSTSGREIKFDPPTTSDSSDSANGTTAYASVTSTPAEYSNSAIWVRDGNFSWTKESNVTNATLQDINLAIKKGSLVAIVGTVGSGKSSLLSALLNDMVKLTGSGEVKGSVAYVPQQAWIQNATVKQNILFTNKYSETKYKKIIDSTALAADIKILSAGDETEIGEKGINLSGGQKQRVSLARAVYSDADVYLLDDPLSAVDTHVGKHIFEKVIGPSGLLKKKTRLLVTHKVTLLPDVDYIIVIKDGKISESGSYHELLDQRGAFSEFLIEYLAERMDEEDEDQNIADIKEKMRPELERHLSMVSGHDSSRGSESELRNRTMSTGSSSYPYSKRRNSSVKNSPEKESLSTTSSKRTSTISSPKPALANSQRGRLTEIESEAIGSVPFSVYISYFRAMGLWACFVVLASLIVSNGFNIASSLWLSYWADDVLYPERLNDTRLRNIRIGVYGALGFTECLFSFVGNLITFLATLTASRLLHNLILEKIMRAPMSFFDTTPQGRILNRFTKDIDSIDTAIRMNIRQFLNSIFRSIVTVIIISLESPYFLLAVIPLSSVYYFIQKYYIATSRQLKRIESTSRSPIYSHFGETVTGSTSIRAFGVTDVFIGECEARTDLNAKSFVLSSAAARWLAVRLEFIGSVIVLIAALLAVTELGSSNPALAGLSISYALSVTQMLNMVVRGSVDLENNLVSAERIIEYTKLPSEADWYNEATRPKINWPDQGHVSFDNYSTRYREGLDLVLRRVSFETKPAEKIGMVGRTGAGKSSITLAMFRLIEPVNGSIMIDHVDISRIGLMDLRSRLTIIPQDPILFTGSLRMNLDPFEKYTDNELWHVLQLAHLKDFVSSLEGGLDHRVTEGGENMSVGQRQLVCLARALLRKSKILILDEATAAVDLETDDFIQKTIRTEFARCTILTIAHRLNTVIDYDRILLLEDGEVAEFDSPQKLMSDPNSKFYSMAKTAGLISNSNGKNGSPGAAGGASAENSDDEEPKPGSSHQ